MPARSSSLRRCRAVWGGTDHLVSLPHATVITDAVYVPESESRPWGLYLDGSRIYEPEDVFKVSSPSPEFDFEALEDGETYIYVGLLVLHYGHFIIDTLSRLWPLILMTGRRPKVLCHRLRAYPEGPEHDFLYAMLAGLGVQRDDIVSFDRVSSIPRVVLAERSFHERTHVHSIFGDLCRCVGQPHWPSSDAVAAEKPLYLSKARLHSGMNRLLNEYELQIELENLGVEVAYPEELGFGDQIALLNRSGPVLGPTTSAFHTAAFSLPGRRIIGLNWSYQINSNFLLFDKFNDTRGYYYWVFKSSYSDVDNFGVGWTVPDPKRLAHDLLERVAMFERLDERDETEEARIARHERGWPARWRRWRQVLQRQLADRRRG